MIEREIFVKEIAEALNMVNTSFKYLKIEEWFEELLKKILPTLSEEKRKEIYEVFLRELESLKEKKNVKIREKNIENEMETKILNLINSEIEKFNNLRRFTLDEEVLALGIVLLKTSQGCALGDLKLTSEEAIRLAHALCLTITNFSDYKLALLNEKEIFKPLKDELKSFGEEKAGIILKSVPLLLLSMVEGASKVTDIYGEIAEEMESLIAEQVLLNELFENEKDLEETLKIINEFINDYYQNKNKPLKEFLVKKFSQYPELWKDKKEMEQTVEEIIKGTEEYNKQREKVDLISSPISMAVNIDLDIAIEQANKNFIETFNKYYKNSGGIHGNLAEIWHAETFNIDATLKGSHYRAKVLHDNSLNSADIGIFDNYGRGNMVDKYQCKYSYDASMTISDTKGHDYSDQHLLVPSDQYEKIKRSVPQDLKVKSIKNRIEKDGVSSQPLSRKEADRLVQKARKKQPLFDWSRVPTKDIIKYEAKGTLKVGIFIALKEGCNIFGRRIVNLLEGKKNSPLQEDLKAWLNSTIKQGVPVALNSALTAALIVAAKKGLIKRLAHLPPGKIAWIVAVALDNVKLIYKTFKGEIKFSEALPLIIKNTTVALGSMALASKGAAIGATIGSIIPGIGTFIGGVIGAIAGGFIGERVITKGYDIIGELNKIKEPRLLPA